MGDTRETVPAGEAFARRIGAGLGQVMIENRLDLRAVDRDLLRSWVEAGPARAPGYHLEFVRGSTLVTSNAASNEAMLSINRQLGFQASAEVKTWQISTERARGYLPGRRPATQGTTDRVR